MSKLVKSSLALVAIGLLSSSALASSGTQDTSFLKKDKEVVPVLVPAPVEQPAKDKYVALEAAYQFNSYKPKYDNAGRTSDNFKDSGAFGIGLGSIVSKNLAVDGMVSYIPETKFDFNSGVSDTYKSKVTTTKLMVNGTLSLDIPVDNVAPYITAGVGGAYNQFSVDTHRVGAADTHYSKNEWKFAYQGGAGLSYKLENESRLNLGYRFADNGKAYQAPGTSSDRLQSHSVVLGLQIPF